MTWYSIQKFKDATKKLLKLINEFSSVAGYKINVQKSVAFLYTNNELSEREIKETVQFIIASKRKKYIGLNLTKEAKAYTWQTIRHRWKKLKTIQINGKTYHAQGLEELIFLKYHTTHGSLQIQCNPYQNINSIFHKTGRNISKIRTETRNTLSSQNNLEKVQWSWRYHTDFKLCYKYILLQ